MSGRIEDDKAPFGNPSVSLLADFVDPEDRLLGSFREYLARAETRLLLRFLLLSLGFLRRYRRVAALFWLTIKDATGA